MTDSGWQDKRTWMVSLISMVLILGSFAVSCLFLINIGVQVYRNVVTANNDNFQLRTSLSYLAARVRQSDRNGCVEITQKEGVEVLSLTEEYEGSIYKTYLYLWDGWLYEHYMEEDGYFEPGYGMNTFEIEELFLEKEDNLLTISVVNRAGDSECLSIGLRSNER